MKRRPPEIDEINMNIVGDEHMRFLTADYMGKHYVVRIALHDYKEILQGDAFRARKYAQELLNKVRKGDAALEFEIAKPPMKMFLDDRDKKRAADGGHRI